jgi:hypothetical protein
MTPLTKAVELARHHLAKRKEWPRGDVELFVADYDEISRALVDLHATLPTDEEREALGFARHCCDVQAYDAVKPDMKMIGRARDVLDRLLAGYAS